MVWYIEMSGVNSAVIQFKRLCICNIQCICLIWFLKNITASSKMTDQASLHVKIKYKQTLKQLFCFTFFSDCLAKNVFSQAVIILYGMKLC